MHYLKEECIDRFEELLRKEELADGTIRSYADSVNRFLRFLGEEKAFDKETVIAYKKKLKKRYKPETINVHVAGLNRFFKEFDYHDCLVKAEKIQLHNFRSSNIELTKEDYFHLIHTAEKNKKFRISLIIQTLGSTGIRVGELPFVTMEALQDHMIRIDHKGKHRIVLMPKKLECKLLAYAKLKGIEKGPVFVTRNLKTIHPKNISRDLKHLGHLSGVSQSKIFPHNFRHLFAKTYYEEVKDLPRLADILGHSNINTTRLYIIKNTEEQNEILDSLQLVVE